MITKQLSCIDDSKIVKITGDGNCLYRAMAHKKFKNQDMFEYVKNDIMGYYMNNKSAIITNEYISNFSKKDSWGSDQEINAFCTINFYTAIVCHTNKKLCYCYNLGHVSDAGLIVLIYDGVHYDLYNTDKKNIDDFFATEDSQCSDDSFYSLSFSDNDSQCSDDSFHSLLPKRKSKLAEKIPNEVYIKIVAKNKSYVGNSAVFGEVQLGKTEHIITESLYLAGEKDTNVVIFTSSSLRIQLKTRFDCYIGSDSKFLIDKYICLIGKNENKKIEKILNKNRNTNVIYIVGADYRNVTEFRRCWKAEQYKAGRKCYVFKDEGDLYNSSVDNGGKYNEITTEIIKFQKMATGNQVITATHEAFTYLRDVNPIKAKDVEFIERTDNYISINDSKFIVRTWNGSRRMYIAKESDINKKQLTNNFRNIIKDMRKHIQNIRCFVSISTIVAVHDIIKDVLSQLENKASFIIANGGKYKYYNSENKLNTFTNMSEAFCSFRDDDDNKKTYPLFVISCKQTGRGTNTRSIHNGKTYSIEDIECTNCQIFDCTDELSTSEMIQRALRGVAGNFPGHQNFPEFKICLYTTATIHKDIKDRLDRDKILKEAILDPANAERELPELIASTAEKIRSVVSKSRGIHRQKVMGDDQVYHTDYTINERQKIDRDQDHDQESEKNNGDVILEKWRTDNSYIGKFMRSFAKIYKKQITKEKFLQMAEDAGSGDPIGFIDDCMKHSKKHSKSKSNYGYGKLFEKIENKYRLVLDLHQRFEEVFLR